MVFESGDHQFTIVTSAGQTLPEVNLEGVDTLSRQCSNCGERLFRSARAAGLIWSGPQNMYRLELHDTLGKLVKRISREVAWFEPWGAEGNRNAADDSPVAEFRRPRMFGVREADDGTLWAHVMGLFDTPPEQLRFDPEQPGAESRFFNLLKTRIEAIDPGRNVVLGSIAMSHLTVPISRDFAAQLEVDEAGDWTWKIMKFRTVVR
jgi:hypothetical protein